MSTTSFDQSSVTRYPHESDTSLYTSGADNADESIASSSAQSNQRVIDTEILRRRGEFISGFTPRMAPRTPRSVNSESEDLESCSEANIPASTTTTWVGKPTVSDSRSIDGRADSPDGKKKSPVWFWATIAIVSLLLIGALASFAYLVFFGEGFGFGKGPVLTKRQQQLDGIVKSISTANALEDTSSPQARARQWLLFDDKLWLNPEDGMPDSRVIQRYSLAVLYYSLGGTEWGQNNWLEGEECDAGWVGVFCNNEREVKTVALGKPFFWVVWSTALSCCLSLTCLLFLQITKVQGVQFLTRLATSRRSSASSSRTTMV